MDPGDHLVNLQAAPSRFDLSPDKRLYYFIHRSLGVLSVFDLEEKKLIKQIQFEKEGPNAIPNFVSSFHAFDENRFLLTGIKNIGIYDSAVVKQISIPFGSDQFSGLSDNEGYALLTGIKGNDSHQLIVSLPNDPKMEKVSLAILKMNAQKGRIVPLPEFGFLTKFLLVFREGDSSNAASFASLDLKMEKDRVVAYSSGTSSIYTFDLLTDSLTFKSYSLQLLPNQAEIPTKSEFTSKPQYDAAINLARLQVSFGDLAWDESRETYFRFASIRKENLNPEAPTINDVFLIAFDQDLNLTGEIQLKDLTIAPTYPFFKDGKLWSYVNVDDELGFAVMDFKF